MIKSHSPQLSILRSSGLKRAEEFSYSEILLENGLEFRQEGIYWMVGESPEQGWAFHISVIKIQLIDLLHKLVPFLAGENVPFKLVANPRNADVMLNSGTSLELTGRLLCIYPESNKALYLAKKLIILTEAFKGPAVQGHRHLGGCVHVKYNGEKKSTYKKRFTPIGISWPFLEITSPLRTKQRKFLAGKYLPVLILKTDTKGKVFKGINFTNVFRPDWCLIKQGKHDMCADEEGRDMHDRLLWQQKLHVKLASFIRVPKLIDMFVEQEDSYLVTEFVQGRSLNEQVEDNISVQRRIAILMKICECLSMLHMHEYMHRDLSPVNFLVTDKNDVCFIDLELVYSVNNNEPNPPYTWGTEGFMSPEQMTNARPAIEQDIYGLGALLLYTLTGVAPLDCGVPDLRAVENRLHSNIGFNSINNMILSCLNPSPEKRPPILKIIRALQDFSSHLNKKENDFNRYQIPGR
jgi:hypothetical protein